MRLRAFPPNTIVHNTGHSIIHDESTMAAKAKSKQEEALQFLDDLDNLAPPPSGAAQGAQAPPPGGEAEVYAFIDEITQKSSEPPRTTISHIDRPLSRAGTPTLRKSAERVKVGAPRAAAPLRVRRGHAPYSHRVV